MGFFRAYLFKLLFNLLSQQLMVGFSSILFCRRKGDWDGGIRVLSFVKPRETPCSSASAGAPAVTWIWFVCFNGREQEVFGKAERNSEHHKGWWGVCRVLPPTKGLASPDHDPSYLF